MKPKPNGGNGASMKKKKKARLLWARFKKKHPKKENERRILPNV